MADEGNGPPAAGDGAEPPASLTQESTRDRTEDDKSAQSDSVSRPADAPPSSQPQQHQASSSATPQHGRRNANGTIGSVYSGNKIRHLKKEDGIPLWRKDIQYSFLRAVFEDTTRCFTLEGDDSGPHHTFADIYINAMARSTKTSKILREKLLSERESAQNMAMICLLVNVGRMNTTLNFFPEMRAQLRTYHSIPCLQLGQETNSQYKGLQDAPRLKSILKGSCEDPEQPTTLDKIQTATIPRTNPVNLIFILSQYAPKISETHFKHPRDFFDLVIRGTLSSRSRAKAFLWLVWWYLESDFTPEAAKNNPFGPGVSDKDEPGSLPFKVPEFEFLTEQQADAENVDTEEEIAYGEKMRLVRKRILEEDETVGPPMKKNRLDDKMRSSPARSDLNRTRSPSPETNPPLRLPKPRSAARAGDDQGTPKSDMEGGGGGRQPRIKFRPSKMERTMASSSPAPAASSGAGGGSHMRRARPETSHQRAVNLNRKMRIESILYRRLVKVQGERRRAKRVERLNRPYMAMRRIVDLPDDYDTDAEGSWGPGGLIPHPDELEDFGSEALHRRKLVDRATRRLARLEGSDNPEPESKNLLSAGPSSSKTHGLGADLLRLLREDKEDVVAPTEAPRRRRPSARVKKAALRRRRNAQREDEEEYDEEYDDEEGAAKGAAKGAAAGPAGEDDDDDDSAAEDSDETELDEDEPVEWATPAGGARAAVGAV